MFFPAHALGAVIAIRAGHLDCVEQQRFVGIGKQRHIAHRHRRDGFAVVTVGEGDEALLRRFANVEPVVKAHFQRYFDAGRAVVGVEHSVQAGRCHFDQAFGQFDHRLMAEAGENHMLQLIDLILDALIDPRVGVAKHVDPPGADRVDVALAIEVLEPHAFATFDRYQRQLFVVLHLRARVPEHLQVTLHPLVIQAHRFTSSSAHTHLYPAYQKHCSGWTAQP